MLEKFSLDSLKDMSKDDLLDLINQINNIPQEILYLCVIIDITGIHVDTPEADTDPDIVFTGGQLLSAVKAEYETR